MSRNAYRGPKLPKFLLDQVHNGTGSHNGQNHNASRKDRRKAEREQKKSSQRHRPAIAARHPVRQQHRGLQRGEDVSSPERIPPQKPPVEAKPLKSILKKPQPKANTYESESEEEVMAPIISRGTRERLEDDDAEISALEKKLGMKSKNSSKALEEDGLDWLANGYDGGSDDGESTGLKRKRPEDAKWLQDKRRKATHDLDDRESDDGEENDLANPFSDDEIDSDDFEGFESEDDENNQTRAASPPKRRRENPYVAPVSADATPTTKYIPPSLRKPATSDEEALKHLRRQVQGLLNRLSEANMLSILQSLEELYTKNPRQHVTSTLVDLLSGLVSDASVLNDTFLILHAGFSAAVYKVVGTDFGAQLLEKVVENLDHFRKSRAGEGSKQTLNLLAFLSCLYNFQLVGSTIMFDYIRLLLDELSESNTELLLRMIRTSGQQLRSEDPSALKDIVLLLQRSVAKVGEDQLSVRTKFMIETINNLKNNRMKTGVAASDLFAEHTTRMKKTLGSLNNSQSNKSTEPLRISLADIRDSEKKGKWWLIGASYNDLAKLANTDTSKKAQHDELDEGYESETPGSVNLSKLARAQGMNTSVRRAIFINILSSADCRDAHERLVGLNLKQKQMVEIPRVLVHCVGAEESYNPFYALVAQKFCGKHSFRKALQFALWDAFRQMEANEDEDDGGEKMSIRKLVNLAKFYGTLIAERGLSIAVLKKLEFAYLDANSSMFVEVLLTTISVRLYRERKVSMDFEQAVKEVFMQAAGAADIIRGLQYVIETVVSKTELANGKKEKRAVETGCRVAIEALDEAARAVPGSEDEEEDG